jgi:D-arabinose 5-phosphate isomerase GutQ
LKTLKAAALGILAVAQEAVLTASTIVENINAKLVAITAYAQSPLRDIANHTAVLTSRTKMGWPREEDCLLRQILSEREPFSSLDSIFENNCTIFLDSLAVELIYCLNNTEEELRRQHATIE